MKNSHKLQPKRFSFVWIYVPLFAVLLYAYAGYGGGDPLETSWERVDEEYIPQGDVQEIVEITNQNRSEVTVRRDSLYKYSKVFNERIPKHAPHFYFNVDPESGCEKIPEARKSLPA